MELLMPAPSPAQAWTDPVVCAGAAAGSRFISGGEKVGTRHSSLVGGVWLHSLVPKRFVWPSERDLRWDPGVVSSPSWPGSTDSLPL